VSANGDDDNWPGSSPEEEPQRDTKIDEAREAIMKEVFDTDPRTVMYERQLLVRFEDKFFHWITARALAELHEERQIDVEKLVLAQNTEIKFYISKGHRGWRLQARAIRDLVLRFSAPDFGYALGHQGEMLFDAALPRFGFMPMDRNVRTWNGREWTESNHDLDRIFVKDGIAYGAEIKNKLHYIERDELLTKLAICAELRIRPLFIMRMAPKSYINDIVRAGGYALIFKYQLYPHGSRAFAKEVRDRLGLPVDSPAMIRDETIERFLNWHVKRLPPPVDV